MSSWSWKLLETMKDPQSIVVKSDKIVAIKDKFPKAKHHYLVLPHENIDTIFHLTKGDIDLVKELNLLGHNVIEAMGQKLENFKIGFHAEPSMMRVHLHVISKDFVSPTLKTRAHWNSFNTAFLWPVSKIINDLETFGKVPRLPPDEFGRLLYVPLKCNSCPFVAKNIPVLKNHLLTHEHLYS